jgi:hypothetical protein
MELFRVTLSPPGELLGMFEVPGEDGESSDSHGVETVVSTENDSDKLLFLVLFHDSNSPFLKQVSLYGFRL